METTSIIMIISIFVLIMLIYGAWFFYIFLSQEWKKYRVRRNLNDTERRRRLQEAASLEEARVQLYSFLYLGQQVKGTVDNNVPPGQTKDYIYEKSTCKNEKYDCAICLEEFKEKETVRIVEPCNHLFHKYCLTKWLPQNRTCPTCRHPIPSLNFAPANATMSEV